MPDQPAAALVCPTCRLKAVPVEGRCPGCDEVVVTAAPVSLSLYDMSIEAAATAPRCLGCAEPLSAEAVVCVKCGYDKRIRGHRTTKVGRAVVANPDDRKRLPPADVGPLRAVLRGLTFHNARLLLGLLGLLVIAGVQQYVAVKTRPAVGQPVQEFGARPGPPWEPPAWVVLGFAAGSGMWLLAVALGFVGSAYCLRIPKESGGQFPVGCALACDVAAVLVGVLSVLLGWPPLLQLSAGLVSWALFMVFLIRLAAYIDRPSEAQESRSILVYGLVLVVAPVTLATAATLSMAGLASAEARRNAPVMVALVVLFSAGFFVRIQWLMIRLLESLRDSLRQQLTEAERRSE